MSSTAPPVTLLTAPGTGGVAVLSVHGDPALARLRSLASGALPSVGEVRLAVLRDPGDAPEAPPLDEALLVGRGDRVEVHTHGSPAIVSAVTSLLGGGGAEPARIPLEGRAELAAASAPTAAPMCTVGPSRPSTNPEPMPSTPPTNFAGTSLISGGRASPQ